MRDFLARLFDAADFLPRRLWGRWSTELVWLHIVADALIWLAYVAIPVVLVYFARRRPDIPFRRMLWLFGAFIVLCGATHLMEVAAFYWPAYRFLGVVKSATAVVSWVTVVAMVPVVPRALAMRSPDDLEREIAERTRAERELELKARQLDDKNQQLIQAQGVRDAFLARVSHELRTPLTLILGPLESLLTGDAATLGAEQAHSLGIVHNNAVRLLQLVTGLLDLAKVEAGKLPVNREPIDIVALTRSVVADFQPAAKRAALELSLHSEVASPVIAMDRHLYERILFNLLSNAVKFTPHGGRVKVLLACRDGRLRLTVQDTGIGIAANKIEQLFQRFHQLDASSTRRFEGVGLGLALVKEFADLLDGEVTATSVPGEGSTFALVCPAPPCDTAARAAAHGSRFRSVELAGRAAGAAIAAPASDRPRILIAEDSEDLASYVASLLVPLAQTRVAADGNAALRQVADWAPDLVLADVMMPGLDGFDLCRAIKHDPSTADIPVVLLTALTQRDALVKGWEAGADEYLFKPFHPNELVTRIKSMLSVALARKRAADVMRHARDELENKVAERTRQLQDLNRALQAEISERQLAEQRVTASLHEKETLLKEIHHRVKNNLQVISSLLNLQARCSNHQAGMDVLRESQHRIESMALIHERLYQTSDLARVAFRPYIEELVHHLLASYTVERNGITARVRVADVSLDVDRAIPCGLLVNELVSNALKHAFPASAGGEVCVELDLGAADQLVLAVRDNGIGLPDSVDPQRASTLGMQLVQVLARQLGGTPEWRRGAGTEFVITMPVSTLAEEACP
ncbi:MAG: ATP-binding protein [Planctomycetota bacterium]